MEPREVVDRGDLHVKNLDWKARKVKKIAAAPASVIEQVVERISLLVEKP